MGNCVGKRNYRYFTCFLYLVAGSISTLFVQTIIFMGDNGGTDDQYTENHFWVVMTLIVGGVICIPISVFLIFVTGLAGFHIYLR